jgi:large subunit ribosomal protein L25
VEALPLDLPPRIEVDITSLVELEQSLHVRDLPLPPNVTLLTDPDVMVVKVSAPRVEEVEEVAAEVAEEGAEAAEGEEAAAEGAQQAEATEGEAKEEA